VREEYCKSYRQGLDDVINDCQFAIVALRLRLTCWAIFFADGRKRTTTESIGQLCEWWCCGRHSVDTVGLLGLADTERVRSRTRWQHVSLTAKSVIKLLHTWWRWSAGAYGDAGFLGRDVLLPLRAWYRRADSCSFSESETIWRISVSRWRAVGICLEWPGRPAAVWASLQGPRLWGSRYVVQENLTGSSVSCHFNDTHIGVNRPQVM